jgi:glyoxylase-like metal-dependent hydrolase (beta-lactamase superfamily II)
MSLRLLAPICGWLTGPRALLGDGRVICLPTFGHTPGHQSLLIRLDGGDVVLAADACYFRETLEELRLPMIVHDPESWATLPQVSLALA